MLRLTALILLLSWVTSPLFAQVDDVSVAAFVEAAKLDETAIEFASQFRGMISMQAAQFPEAAANAFRENLIGALADENVLDRLHRYVAQQADAEQLEAALAWRADPAIDSLMTQMEAVSRDPAAQVPIQMYTTTGRLGRHQVSPEREALAQAYLEVSGTAEGATRMFGDVIVASNQITAALLEIEMPPEEVLREQIREQLGEATTAPIRGTVLYALREVSDEDFEAFIAAADSDAGRYFNRFAVGAVGQVVAGAISSGGEAFLTELHALDEAGEFDLDAWRAEARRQMPQPPGDDEAGAVEDQDTQDQ